ncbi:MAG: nitroreductase family protein [Elusimicrobia bacterium]|nr:nitroreductase family protein [Elusimicrobiota bacterium]
MSSISSDKFIEILKTRRSVREFLPDPIPEADIEKMIEAASFAPSGSNLQNWYFIVITSDTLKKIVFEAVLKQVDENAKNINSSRARKEYISYSEYFKFFVQAPAVIAVVKKPYETLSIRIMKRYNIPFKSNSDIQGVSAAVQNLLLMAHVLGYGACWMTGPLIAREKIEDILKIDKENELAAFIPVGKYKKSPAATPRKNIKEIYSFVR